MLLYIDVASIRVHLELDEQITSGISFLVKMFEYVLTLRILPNCIPRTLSIPILIRGRLSSQTKGHNVDDQ